MGLSKWQRVAGTLLLVMVAVVVRAQQAPVAQLVTAPVDDSQLTLLRGNRYPVAIPKYDRGVAPDSLPMERMLLVLKRSTAQETALHQLLDDQQNSASPNYHKWLTPQEFGKRFGIGDADLEAVTGWLLRHGFEVTNVAKGRTVIEFRGTAGQVREAFHTEIHKYAVAGKEHWANSADPQIPTALSQAVAGIWSLHNFEKKPDLVMSKERFHIVKGANGKPEATNGNGQHALGPVDYATIYGIKPVYQASINGNNVNIAVVGRTDINGTDVSDFRSTFLLSGGSFTMVNNGPDPGNLGGGEEAEAILDSTWSGAVAPGANVILVVSATTDTTDGVDLSELYIVDNNLGDVMTESFSSCELALGATQLAGIGALAEQAAAQGISYTVSTGDTGSSGCDDLSETVAVNPISANGLASTPFNVAVGGTLFNENGQDSKYWNPTPGLNTALSYIPENVWNESCAASTCVSPNTPNIAAGGGGVSTFFLKPSWQAGVANIPNDGARDLPDVSLSAAGHDPYLLCYELSCSQQGELFGISGTSASTPAFAGILALVNQKAGHRLGQPNYVLYRLAATETLSQCNASNTAGLPASTCIFNDVTAGTNSVPNVGGSTLYASTTGYDRATGLGSVNVANLVNKWNTVTFNPTTTTLTLAPLTGITHGSAVNVNITVAKNGGTGGTPTGDVSLIASLNGGTNNVGVDGFTLASGSVASTTNVLPGGANYTVTAHYAGDTTYAPSDSAPVTVTVTPENSTTTASALIFDSTGQSLIPFTTTTYGSFIYLRADVAGVSGNGTPSGPLSFLDSGNPLGQYSLNSQGNAATPNGIFGLAPGGHAVRAQYSGDTSFQTSTSAAVNFSITPGATTSALQLSPTANVTPATSVVLTANIGTNSAGLGPSGTVTFLNGSTTLGSSSVVGTNGGVLSGGFFSLASGAALLSTTLPAGTASLTAQYGGDANYSGSTTPVSTLTVSPDFQVPTSLNAVTISSPGQSGTTTLAITGQPGYTGTISFTPASCAGLPAEASCSFSPASVTGSGTTTITVSTMAPHANRQVLPGAFLLVGMFLLGVPKRKRWSGLVLLLALAGVLTMAGCGGGSSSGGGTTGGTPLGTYPITVTASSGSLSHTTKFTLNVN